MLSLERHTGSYRSSAFALVVDGQVVGEIVLLRVQSCDGRGNGQVSVGFNLAPEIEVVRADAVNRPSGPSYEWLRERDAAYIAGGGYSVVTRVDNNEFPVVAVIGQVEDVPLPSMADGLTLAGADDVDDVDDADPGRDAPLDEDAPPPPQRILTGQRPIPRRPPSVAPMPLAPADRYVLRRENRR